MRWQVFDRSNLHRRQSDLGHSTLRLGRCIARRGSNGDTSEKTECCDREMHGDRSVEIDNRKLEGMMMFVC
jgi:hypothetical protein